MNSSRDRAKIAVVTLIRLPEEPTGLSLRLRTGGHGIYRVPEIAAGFHSLLKEGAVSASRYSDKYSGLAQLKVLSSGRMSERISVSIELEFFNKYLFNAL